MDKIRVGLVGLGRFGRLHARVLDDLPGCTISALCEVDAATLQGAGEEYGVRALYTDLSSMLRSETLDAIDIVTDEASHGGQARLALESGCAVFVEKPLATDRKEAETIVKLARQTGLPVLVGHISRFDARYTILRRELEAGKFGQVAIVYAKRSFSRAWFEGFGARVHPVFESMIHDLDLVLWYLQAPIKEVYARSYAADGNQSGVPNVLAAVLTAADNSIAIVQSTWLVPNGAPITLAGPPTGPLDLWGTIDAQLELVGTAQVGRVNLLAGDLSLWDDSHTRLVDTGLWPDVHGRVSGALREELAHFLDCVRTKTPSTIVSPETALLSVSLAEAIVRSAHQGHPLRLTETGEVL